MGAQGFVEVCQHRPALQTQRLHHRQDALHETATALAVTAERTLPPQHRTTQHTLRMIVRRLYALDKGERPQRLLPGQQLPTRSPCRRAAAAQTATQQRHHVRPNRVQYLTHEPGPADRPITHLRPILEQHARQGQQVLADSSAGAATLAQGTEIADQVRPTQLPSAVGQDLVDLPTVADDNAMRWPRPTTLASQPNCGGHAPRRRPPWPWPPATTTDACRPDSNWSRRRA